MQNYHFHFLESTSDSVKKKFAGDRRLVLSPGEPGGLSAFLNKCSSYIYVEKVDVVNNNLELLEIGKMPR